MNAKQQRFILEYLKDRNATQAAIRAGYSKRTAGSQGHDLLKNPEISGAILKKSAAIAEKQEISVEWVLEKLKATATSCEVPAVATRATELIGKHLGMFSDRVELTGKNGGPVQTAIEVRFVGGK